jgi:lipopolysaccharide transport protein LptA
MFWAKSYTLLFFCMIVGVFLLQRNYSDSYSKKMKLQTFLPEKEVEIMSIRDYLFQTHGRQDLVIKAGSASLSNHKSFKIDHKVFMNHPQGTFETEGLVGQLEWDGQPTSLFSVPIIVKNMESEKSIKGTYHSSRAPIYYSADILKVFQKESLVRLEGHVKITQEDTEITSDTADIFMSGDGKWSPQRALAKGHVVLIKNETPDNIRGESEEMDYSIPEEKILFKGKPKVWRGPEKLFGETIQWMVKTGEITVFKAQGVLQPKSNR